jgi:hypothetical protein
LAKVFSKYASKWVFFNSEIAEMSRARGELSNRKPIVAVSSKAPPKVAWQRSTIFSALWRRGLILSAHFFPHLCDLCVKKTCSSSVEKLSIQN